MKLAVIGTGWIVKSFIDGLKFAPDFELFAVYSRSRERGETFAKENGISTVYTSLDELAASPAECVYIASPNALHYTQSKKMLESGKHVICEKPITVTPDEFSELCEIADGNKLIYIEAIMYMHSPVRAALREALGDIGKVWTAHFDFSQYSSKYPVYPPIDLFGEPDIVSAVSAFLESGADAATAVSMLSKNTAITMTSCKTGQDHAGSQIIGERGSIKIGSNSKLTDIELVMNNGTSRIICGDTPKDELMGNEARAFYKLITEPENNREKYRELRETALSVSRTMQRIRESAGIKFDGGIA